MELRLGLLSASCALILYAARCRNARRRCAMTVIITTSPVPSNPSTDMIEAMMGSFSIISGLKYCRKIIVCDGYKTSSAKSKPRRGIVTEEDALCYEEYVARLQTLSRRGEGVFSNSVCIALNDRQGFSFAVKAAIAHVTTPFVMIKQHDHIFVRKFDLEAVLNCMSKHNDVKYVGVMSGATLNYPAVVKSKYNVSIAPISKGGILLCPLLYFYDKTRICPTDYYRQFVFGQKHSRESQREASRSDKRVEQNRVKRKVSLVYFIHIFLCRSVLIELFYLLI